MVRVDDFLSTTVLVDVSSENEENWQRSRLYTYLSENIPRLLKLISQSEHSVVIRHCRMRVAPSGGKLVHQVSTVLLDV